MDDTVIIEVTPKVLGQDSLIDSVTSLFDSQKKFLKDLIAVAETIDVSSDGNTLVPRKALQEYILNNKGKASDPLISKRLKSFVDLEIADFTTHMQSGRSRINHYLIRDLAPLAAKPAVNNKGNSKPASRRTKTIVTRQKELFRQDNNSVLLENPSAISIFFHEQVFNGVLDAAMRLSPKDDRKEIIVDAKVAGKPLRIIATCSSSDDSAIAVLTDQRAMRSIISYCKKEIATRKARMVAEQGEDEFNPLAIPNSFRIDIHDLCDLMRMQCVNTNLDQIVQMMQRLADTKFRVDATQNDWFRDSFSLQPGGKSGPKSDTFEFRFLTNFEIAHENAKIEDLFGADLTELRPRFYTFSLEIRIFYTLLLDGSSNLFLSHDSLASERSGIIQRFYNWARAYISGRPKKGLENRWFTMREMYDHLTPAARFDNFRTYFLRALEKFACKDVKWKRGASGKSLVYGYYVFYERRNGEDCFRFERDPTDEIVGDNSRHNVLLRKSMMEQLPGFELKDAQ